MAFTDVIYSIKLRSHIDPATFYFLRFDPSLCAKNGFWSRELNDCCRRKITDAKNFICDCISIRMSLNRGTNWFEKEC